MLEAIHLTKVYKTIGGAQVRALDDVSIQFPEKGMVFLLGKSGSGKSTLLNVCGGLDAPTNGAIVVKGKSSEKFSQSDFDSYRNTYVGFIFQEYNILNEFTVEDNIALALELQGKPKDKKVIADLLEQVDLTGYAKRKPNTLSGGQKQRIAIARALVKSPEIIMADEPTGALDSATGKQVFDTLKKLSKDKLVIVVSHDRDFAEMYGDRIIELKDGKVLSDVTKTQEQQQALTDNISIVGDTLCVKNGADLDEKDFAEIKAFLSKTEKDIIIAAGERDVKTFKEVSHIKDNGEKEVFKDSAELPMEEKEYDPKNTKFIRSRLPLRHAIKIGVSGMATKPVRLLFTVLLCTVAFTFFGLLSTMMFYDSEATFKQSVKDSSFSLAKVGKYYEVVEKYFYDGVEDEWTYSMETRFTEDELKKYAEIFGEDTFGGVAEWSGFNVQSRESQYWISDVNMFAYLDEDNVLREKITGKYPESDNEICISSYGAEVLFNCKAYEAGTGRIIELSSPNDIIGKKIALTGEEYTVVGIIDSGDIPEKYEPLKESSGLDMQLYLDYQMMLGDGLHQMAFVTKDRMISIGKNSGMYGGMDKFASQRVLAAFSFDKKSFAFPEWANGVYGNLEEDGVLSRVLWLSAGKESLSKKEVVVSKEQFVKLLLDLYLKEVEKAEESGDEAQAEQVRKVYEQIIAVSENGTYVENPTTHKWDFKEFTEEESAQKFAELLLAIQSKGTPLTLTIQLFSEWDGVGVGETQEFTVVGVWNTDSAQNCEKILFHKDTEKELWKTQKSSMAYYSEYSTKYIEPENAIYGTIYVPYDHSDEQTQILWDIYSEEDYGKDGSKDALTSTLINNLQTVDTMIETLSQVFLYVGLVLAAFAALLLSNFISVSISYKKREIGILRAVGARSVDVFKIFFSESFAIAAICVGISTAACLTLCGVINGYLISLINASLLVFGVASLVVLVAIALITILIATFLPVWNIAKKKPVESIRAL